MTGIFVQRGKLETERNIEHPVETGVLQPQPEGAARSQEGTGTNPALAARRGSRLADSLVSDSSL